MSYTLRHFAAAELLPECCDDISVLDERLLETIDDVRDILDTPCTINDYSSGGKRQWCGFRTKDCGVGAPHSQHRLGRAADLHPVGMDADTARDKIREAVAAGKLPHLGGMELGVSWLHVDVRPRINGKVVEFHA